MRDVASIPQGYMFVRQNFIFQQRVPLNSPILSVYHYIYLNLCLLNKFMFYLCTIYGLNYFITSIYVSIYIKYAIRIVIDN